MDRSSSYVRTPRAENRPTRQSGEENNEDQRRARARRAQRAFKLRRKATVTALENRVNLLESAIEGMSNEFIGLGDRLVRSQARKDPAMLHDLRGTMRRFLQIVRSTDGVTDDHEDESCMETAQAKQPPQELPWSTAVSARHISLATFEAIPSIVTELPGFFTQPHEIIGSPSLDLIETPGRFSPRLSYGILDDSLSALDPIPTVFNMDYLIGGLNSFATRLFFDSVELVWLALSGQLYFPGFIASACRYRLRHDRPEVLKRLCYSKTSQMRSAGVGIDNSSFDSDFGAMEMASNAFTPEEYARLKHAMIGCVSELVRDGSSPYDWLDPWNTYQYIRKKWRLKLTSSVIVVPSHTLRSFSTKIFTQVEGSHNTVSSAEEVFGPEQPDIIVSAQQLLQRLALESICLGDGPRYAKPQIDEAVRSFLGEISGMPVAV